MKSIFIALSELLFPTQCIACGAVMRHRNIPVFCEDCFAKIKFIRSPLCSCCGTPFESAGNDHLCGSCMEATPVFSVARSAGCYETVLMDAIHQFKYRGKTAIGKGLGALMAEFPYPGFSIVDCSLIIPVPLHLKRLRERGFNQSVILAREIARKTSLPLDLMALRRTVHTDPQISLGRKEREKNVRGAFGMRKGKTIAGERILLVDDVYTTGSTLRECARVLKKHGARQVTALTLARAVSYVK